MAEGRFAPGHLGELTRLIPFEMARREPFVVALGSHARRTVIAEVAARHPLTELNPLWQQIQAVATRLKAHRERNKIPSGAPPNTTATSAPETKEGPVTIDACWAVFTEDGVGRGAHLLVKGRDQVRELVELLADEAADVARLIHRDWPLWDIERGFFDHDVYATVRDGFGYLSYQEADRDKAYP
ncbi:hypothetical protein [Saccharopolyspora antimicrobica]|uniref:hypothetical protein n=1 Tax=Saccharopolyspora antimicrobica TaxID=455193 RepID=UPI000B83441C|nr:hypothetical protein [Saccharopolyspora antimicrobica]